MSFPCRSFAPGRASTARSEWTPTGSQPCGAHGSRYAPLLERNYDVNDPSSASFQSDALCYKCHNRDSPLGDRVRTFAHRLHVVDKQSSCAACHDAHGSRQSPALINFMVRDRTGKVVVSPSAGQRRLEFTSLGNGPRQEP
jgi:predicted CXXCH cytochrome family protein